MGVAAALAGMMNSLQIVNFYPNMGTGYLLPTLAAVFVESATSSVATAAYTARSSARTWLDGIAAA